MPTVGQMGWVEDRPGFTAYAAGLERGDDFWDSLRAADDGGDRFWYRAIVQCLREVGGAIAQQWLKDRGSMAVLRSLNQGSIGSCVGNANGLLKTANAALNILRWLRGEAFFACYSPEWEYYASRKMSGMIGRGDGSTGYGAAKSSVEMGALMQGVYGGVDVSKYSVSTCGQWGAGRGIPQEAIAEAAKHKCGRYVSVDTAEKAWLCAGAGIPINQCSNVGWNTNRDSDGACRRSGSWNHSMLLGLARRTTKAGRKLILINQSWGDDWTGGDYYADQPWGAFYSELDDVERAVSQGDTFADIEFVGDPATKPNSSFTEA
jgi:hypothetical protein